MIVHRWPAIAEACIRRTCERQPVRGVAVYPYFFLPLLCLLIGIFLPISVAVAQSAPSPGLKLGVNVNENLDWLLPNLLNESQTTWVRGFVPASEFISGKRSFLDDPGLRALNSAAKSGHKVILSIKWDCNSKNGLGRVPAAGSPEEHAWFRFVDDLLASTAGHISILVVDNELFIDTSKPDLVPGPNGQVPMVEFLKRLVDHIGANHPHAPNEAALPIYVGGLTRVDTVKMQSDPATKQMLSLINGDNLIAGADFHMHQPDMESSFKAMEFMHRSIPAKPLIVTEFSLVWKWKRHLPEEIGASTAGKAFAREYSLSPTMTVAEYCNQAFAHPVPEQEWHAFLASQPWFVSDYLDRMASAMQQNGIVVATYAFTLDPNFAQRPDRRHVTASVNPWYLNQLLIPGLADVPNNSRVATNYGFFTSFVNWQERK